MSEGPPIFLIVGASVVGCGVFFLVYYWRKACLRTRRLRREAKAFNDMDRRIAAERVDLAAPKHMSLTPEIKGDRDSVRMSYESARDEVSPIKDRFAQAESAAKRMSKAPPNTRERPISMVSKNPDFIIKQNPVSAKALKMLGASAEQTVYAFDGTVNERMSKLAAAQAKGGLYTTGQATAELGPDIIDGFKQKRAKAEKHKAEREEFKRQTMAIEAQKEATRIANLSEDERRELAAEELEKERKREMESLMKADPSPDKFAAFMTKNEVQVEIDDDGDPINDVL